MSGGGFDPCECINLLNHEQRMQRLISMLRNSQTFCNDNECFNEAIGPNNSGVLTPGDDATETSMLTLIIGWIMIAMVLLFLRPNLIRRLFPERNQKSNNNNPRGNDDPDNQPVL